MPVVHEGSLLGPKGKVRAANDVKVAAGAHPVFDENSAATGFTAGYFADLYRFPIALMVLLIGREQVAVGLLKGGKGSRAVISEVVETKGLWPRKPIALEEDVILFDVIVFS